MRELFRHFAARAGEFAGSPWAFLTGVFIVLGWALVGPYFGYSDAWQLFINTGTTIVTFLMVFLIQNMQNRDAKAMHLKLDELLRAVKDARSQLINLETLSDEDIDKLQKEFVRLQRIAAMHAHNKTRPADETAHL